MNEKRYDPLEDRVRTKEGQVLIDRAGQYYCITCGTPMTDDAWSCYCRYCEIEMIRADELER